MKRTDVAPRTEPPPSNPQPPAVGWRRFLGACKAEWAFLALGLPFGLVLLVLTPPFQVPDEEAHLRRAFEISDGRLIAEKRGQYTGDNLPRSLEACYQRFRPMKAHPEEKTTADAIREAAAIPLDPSDREFTVFSNSAIHPPLPYLPQAVGVLLARAFSSSALVCLYAGRVANLLACLAVAFFAIRATPVGKWVFVTLALLPMALTLDASQSPDGLTNALCLLLVARVLAGAQGPEAVLSNRSVAGLALCGAAIGWTKQSYFLLPLCYLLIPVRKLATRRRYWTGLACVMGATFLAVGLWALVVRQVWSPADPKMGMDPREQLVRLRSNPGEFLHLLWVALKDAPRTAEEFLGRLGWAEVRLPVGAYVGALALLGLLSLWDFGPRARLSAGQTLVAAGVALLVSLTVVVIIHLTWDKVGAPFIALHGRYFLPVGPLVCIVIGRLGFAVPSLTERAAAAMPTVATAAVAVLLATAVGTVYERFYVDTPADAARRHSLKGEAYVGEGPGKLDQARKEFEAALEIDPEHGPAHRWLGLMNRDSNPAAAERHFQALLRADANDPIALFEMANLLSGRGDFAAAVPLYDKALALSQGNENVKRNREHAVQMQLFLRQIAADFAGQLNAGMVDERPAGGAGAGRNLKPNRGPVAARGDQPALARLPFQWRSPPPTGAAIRMDAPADPVTAGERAPFFACSLGLVGGKRVFVFAPAATPRLLADRDVSWYFQVPLAALDEESRRREEGYRRERGLQFPLTRLPE